MALNEKQQAAMNLEIEKYPLEMTLQDIADHKDVSVDIRTLRRWRASAAWKTAFSELDTDEMKTLFVNTVKDNPNNAQMWKCYWDRFGGEDEDLIDSILRMTEDDAVKIAKEAARWFVEQGGVSAVEELVSIAGPDSVPKAANHNRRGR